jgi:hypothetical protein
MKKKNFGTYFDETESIENVSQVENVEVKNVEVESTSQDLIFESVDTGDFEIPRMTEKGDTFVGKFVRFWSEEKGDLFSGIEFLSYPDKRRSILPDTYKLGKFFSELQDKEGKSYDIETTIFKIVRTGTKELDKGSIALYDILAATKVG